MSIDAKYKPVTYCTVLEDGFKIEIKPNPDENFGNWIYFDDEPIHGNLDGTNLISSDGTIDMEKAASFGKIIANTHTTIKAHFATKR